MAARAFDLLDRRVLAALTFVDVLGQPVRTPVAVVSEGARFFTRRPGELVLAHAPGLEAHTMAFVSPPTAPGVGSLRLVLDLLPADPAYAARRFALPLPRDPDPAHAAQPDSLFRPVEVPLLPGPRAMAGGLSAGLVVTVLHTDGRRVEDALVRLRPSGGRPPTRALTDAAGDALLLVAGIPLASPGAGATVTPDVAGEIDVIVDPDQARFHRLTELDEARLAQAARSQGFVDPDDLETRLAGEASAPQAVRLAAGRTGTARIEWAPP